MNSERQNEPRSQVEADYCSQIPGQPMCYAPLLCNSVLRLTWPLPGDFFIPSYQCPHRFERVGIQGDGGKWACDLDRVAKQDKYDIYSFGPPLLSHLPAFVVILM